MLFARGKAEASTTIQQQEGKNNHSSHVLVCPNLAARSCFHRHCRIVMAEWFLQPAAHWAALVTHMTFGHNTPQKHSLAGWGQLRWCWLVGRCRAVTTWCNSVHTQYREEFFFYHCPLHLLHPTHFHSGSNYCGSKFSMSIPFIFTHIISMVVLNEWQNCILCVSQLITIDNRSLFPCWIERYRYIYSIITHYTFKMQQYLLRIFTFN